MLNINLNSECSFEFEIAIPFITPMEIRTNCLIEEELVSFHDINNLTLIEEDDNFQGDKKSNLLRLKECKSLSNGNERSYRNKAVNSINQKDFYYAKTSFMHKGHFLRRKHTLMKPK